MMYNSKKELDAFYKWSEKIQRQIRLGMIFESLREIRSVSIPKLFLDQDQRKLIMKNDDSELRCNSIRRVLSRLDTIIAYLIERIFSLYDEPSKEFVEYLEKIIVTCDTIGERIGVLEWYKHTGFVSNLVNWFFQAKSVHAYLVGTNEPEQYIPKYRGSSFIKETLRYIFRSAQSYCSIPLPNTMSETIHGIDLVTFLCDSGDKKVWEDNLRGSDLPTAAKYAYSLTKKLLEDWQGKKWSFRSLKVEKISIENRITFAVNSFTAFFSLALNIFNEEGKYGTYLAIKDVFSGDSKSSFRSGMTWPGLGNWDDVVQEDMFLLLLKYSVPDFWNKCLQDIGNEMFLEFASRAGWEFPNEDENDDVEVIKVGDVEGDTKEN